MPNFTHKLDQITDEATKFTDDRLGIVRGYLEAAEDVLAELVEAGIDVRVSWPTGYGIKLTAVRFYPTMTVKLKQGGQNGQG